MAKENKTHKKGYGKRPLWQWILLYIVVGAIVYALIYFLLFNHSGSSSGSYSY